MEQQSIGNPDTYDSESNFNLLFERMPQSLMMSEYDSGKIIKINEFFCLIFGFKAKELIGKSSLEIGVWNNFDRKIFIDDLDQNQSVNGLEVLIHNKSGEPVYVLLYANVLYLSTCKTILTMIVDISNRKKVELLLAKQSEELKKLVASKDREITLNLLQLANNNQFNLQLSLKLKKVREQIKSESHLLLNDIDKLIDETANNQQPINWNRLNEHFMLTRPSFLSGLLSKHQNLTSAEQKLCTLLSLQIGTKEIALITNQKYDSIRVSRTRLRKKLGLENENSLVAYLLSL
jgi:PAS domain S-box-containing protein